MIVSLSKWGTNSNLHILHIALRNNFPTSMIEVFFGPEIYGSNIWFYFLYFVFICNPFVLFLNVN